MELALSVYSTGVFGEVRGCTVPVFLEKSENSSDSKRFNQIL